MNEDFINLKDQASLNLIREHLETTGVHSTLLEASEHLDYNILISILPDGSSVNIMYLPLPEDHFEETRFIQFYAMILAEIDKGRKADLLALLNEVNSVCPLGSVIFNKMGELGYKYVFPVSRFNIPEKGSFLELFSVYQNSLHSYRDVLVDLDAGTISLADALNSLVQDNN